MAIQFYNGQVLFNTGQVATDAACCCEDTGDCPDNCDNCCGASSVYEELGPFNLLLSSGIEVQPAMVYQGNCVWEGSVSNVSITQADINYYYGPQGIPVLPTDGLQWRLRCSGTAPGIGGATGFGTGWVLELITDDSASTPNTVLIQMPAFDDNGTGNYIFPYNSTCPVQRNYTGTSKTRFREVTPGPSNPRVNNLVIVNLADVVCNIRQEPPPCTFDPVNDCTTDSALDYLKIDDFLSKASGFDMSSCACSDLGYDLPWPGAPLVRNYGNTCYWEDDGSAAGRTIDGHVMESIKIVPVAEQPPSASCGLYLEFWCTGGVLLWRGLKTTAPKGNPTGTYVEVTDPARKGCGTLSFNTLTVSKALATYVLCSTGGGNATFGASLPALPDSTGSCGNPYNYPGSYNAVNTTGGNAELWAVSVTSDDDLTVNGVPVSGGCPLVTTYVNRQLTPAVPPFANVALSCISYSPTSIWMNGTFEWRVVGGPASNGVSPYIGQYARGPGGDCYKFLAFNTENVANLALTPDVTCGPGGGGPCS